MDKAGDAEGRENSGVYENHDKSPKLEVQLQHKKTFLTPCRRLGLSRVSPGLQKNVHTPKRVLQGNSSINSPNCNISNDVLAGTSNKSCVNTQTPLRRGLPKQLSKSTPKRLKIMCPDQEQAGSTVKTNSSISQTQKKGTAENEINGLSPPPTSESHTDYKVRQIHTNTSDIHNVKKRIKKKEEELRAFQQSNTYKRKHDPDVLTHLINRWRKGCQDALEALLEEINARGNNLRMTEMLTHMNISCELVQYNPELEEFEQ